MVNGKRVLETLLYEEFRHTKGQTTREELGRILEHIEETSISTLRPGTQILNQVKAERNRIARAYSVAYEAIDVYS